MIAQSSFSAAWMQPEMVVSSHTVPWPQPNLLAFLRRAKGMPRFFWDSDRALTTFAAFGSAAVLTARGPERFQSIRRQAQALFARIRTGPDMPLPPEAAVPRLVGGFSFRESGLSLENGPDIWSSFGQAYFVLPKYILFTHADAHYLTVNTVSHESDEWAAQEALWELPAPLDMPVLEDLPEAVKPQDLMPEALWHTLVRSATGEIRSGLFSKIVLARAREFPAISNPVTALVRLAGRYPDCFRFLM